MAASPINWRVSQIRPGHRGIRHRSVLVSMGKTRVLCGVTIEEAVPRWMKEQRVPGAG